MIWFANASEAIWILAQCFLTWKLIAAIAEERFRHGITVSVCVVVSLATAGFEIFNITRVGPASSGTLTGYSLVLFLTGIVIYKSHIIDILQTAVITWEFGRLGDYFFQTIMYGALKNDFADPRVFQVLSIQRGVALIFYTVLIVLLSGKIRIIVKKYIVGTWLLRWPGIPVSIAFWVLLGFLQRIYYTPTDLVNEHYLFMWSLVIIIAVIITVILWILHRRGMLQKENLLRRQQIEYMEDKYIQLLEQYQERRQLVHDSKNNFMTLKHFIENQEIAEAERYLNELLPEQEMTGVYRWSGHEILDMILSTKAEEAKAAGIECRFFSDDMNGMQLNDVEVSSLFGNLLDNAIEAQRDKESIPEKWIELNVKRKQDTLYVNIRNPYDGIARFEDGKPITTKKNKESHGVGSRVIEKYVKRYDGTLRYRTEGQIYSVEIILNAF